MKNLQLILTMKVKIYYFLTNILNKKKETKVQFQNTQKIRNKKMNKIKTINLSLNKNVETIKESNATFEREMQKRF